MFLQRQIFPPQNRSITIATHNIQLTKTAQNCSSAPSFWNTGNTFGCSSGQPLGFMGTENFYGVNQGGQCMFP